MPNNNAPEIAFIIPCLNEEVAIGRVIADCRKYLPGAMVFVYDNGSTDNTCRVARECGAIVRVEPLRGKGNVVRRMFADVEADIYIMIDGDGTYDIASAPRLVNRLIEQSLDLVNGTRQEQSVQAYRAGHRFGNRMLTQVVSSVFGKQVNDMLTGFRVMSRRFVKSFPALTQGFEIETELTVHALQLRVPVADEPTPYLERAKDSHSKLRTIPDGLRILNLISQLIREEKPLQFFSGVAGALALAALVLMVPVLSEYFRTGLVPRLPTAVLSTGLMLLAFLSFGCGLILSTVTRGRIEAKRIQYLNVPIRFRETEDKAPDVVRKVHGSN